MAHIRMLESVGLLQADELDSLLSELKQTHNWPKKENLKLKKALKMFIRR